MEKSHVLVVGNEYTAARDVAAMLRAAGDLVTDAVEVREAFPAIRQATPDLIVMDVAPGDVLQSVKVAEKLCAGLRNPVIYLVCADDALLLQRTGMTAPQSYLLKPVYARELDNAIRAALYRHESEQRLVEREVSYRGLFEDAPFPVWEEDFSAVKAYLDGLHATGVDDVERYLCDNPDVVRCCASLVKIVNVNQAAVELFGAADKAALLHGLDTLFVEHSLVCFADELVAFLRRQRRFESETVGRKLNGELMNVLIQATLVSGYELTWGKVFVMAFDINARKRMESEREWTIALLHLINEKHDLHDLVEVVLDLLQRELGYHAVGIRLKQGDDFPYYDTRGFSPEFVQAESTVCALNQQGEPVRDSAGNPGRECMCGNVLCGRFDPALPWFTAHGSFWTNNITTLLASTDEAARQAYTRNRCKREGYESMALIPLRTGAETIGLLQFNDRRIGRFEPQTIVFLEYVADSLATALAHRRAEAALKRSVATLRSIFSAASIGIGLVSNRVLLQVNARICEMTGYTQEELVGQSSRLLYPSDEDSEYVGREKVRQISECGIGTVETHWRCKDGHVLDVWLSFTPLDPTDLTVGVTFTALDITERKRAEKERERLLQQVQEQTRQMQQIMDTVPEGVFLLDAELRLRLCNPSALTYLPMLTETVGWETGQTLTALGQHPIAELLTPPPRGLWHEIDAKHYHFQITARAIETGPMMGGWVLVIRDVTEEYAFRETVQRQDRLATVGQLAAGIAHDFNNILAGIVLYSQMSLRMPDLPPQLNERLAIIANQAHRAADLINQILDFSRSTVLDRLALDVVLLLKEQVKLWERTLPENIHVNFIYGVDDYVIDADPTRMQQVFMNLVVNARDAMPDGGTLSIAVTRLRVTKPNYVPLPGMAVGDWVLISVSDTGSGIPEAALPYIYDPFFTTKPVGKGTGLGLSQVYGIVSSHDGFIDVYTEMNVGTTFFLYFPALTLSQAPAVDVFDDLPLGHGETILVVEDNAAARAAIVASLELLNYRVLEAENGKVALTIVAEHREEIVLVLSDLVMAEMGGKALAQALHQQAPLLRVVVMTGYPLRDEREALHEAGVVAWIQKPPELRGLAETLARVCAGGAALES